MAQGGDVVLITGGTGSFGSTMARELLDNGAAEVRVFSRDEAKQEHMRQQFADERLRFYLGDVRDRASVDRATAGAHYVFHAAALKQVPSCEFFPMEAVRTNVVGSDNVIGAAAGAGVRSVVCLSTDKAVLPVNAMGMTKALMEKVVQAHARNHPDSPTTVSLVRYGNVMYSRGSVIPLFVRQIRAQQPLTVTDTEMTRFMMSLSDSVELVQYAFGHAQPGDLFVRKAPACTIGVLVEALCELFGVAPQVRTIGIRHGEKIFETLATVEELARSQDRGDYYQIAIDGRGLDYSQYFDQGEALPPAAADFTSDNATRLTVDQLQDLLLRLPEMRRELTDAGRPVPDVDDERVEV